MATQRANTLILFLFTLTIITQIVICSSSSTTATPSKAADGLTVGPRGTIAKVVTPAFFKNITSTLGRRCPAKGFYTRLAFLVAVQRFPAYRGAVTKREIAAILAQFSFDTDGFCYKEEKAKDTYCRASRAYPCKPGKRYYGRSPLKIRWNYNYGAAGKDIKFGDFLLTDSDVVTRVPDIAFSLSLWFWNKNVRPVLYDGFGATTKKISNDCYGYHPAAGSRRAELYQDFCKMLGITPGENLYC